MDQQCLLSSCVDSDNFELVYKFISDNQLPSKASFIAFDLEMTGIKGDYLDTFEEYPFERFYKMRKVAQKFSIIQFGLCFFIKQDQNYLCYPFTFYLFPSEEDSVIGLQVGAVKFNNVHKMDWNRWIYKGISYLNEKNLNIATEKNLYSQQDKTEEQVQEKIQQDESAAKSMKENMKEEDKQVTQDYINQITQWLQSENKTLEIEIKNAYHKKYLYSYLGSVHPQIYVKTVDGVYTLRKVNEEEKLELDQKNKIEREQQFQKKQGFSKLWAEIRNVQKPLVGHNCFADLLFIYSHLVDRIPPSYEQFKTELNSRLKIVCDTKYIFNQCESLQKVRETFSQDTTLENLLQLGQKDEKFNKYVLADELQTYAQNDQLHEAGYDAYLTGQVYGWLINMMEENEIKQAQNKLNIYKSNQVINLAGEDQILQQKTLFFIKLPDQKNAKKQQQQKMQQEVLNKVEFPFTQYLQNQQLQAKQIHLKYYMLDIKSTEENIVDEIEDTGRTFCNKNPEYQFMTESNYRSERRDMKEKEAKFEKFDKK